MISVDELAAVETLGVRYLAGESGGFRAVAWAHVCDLPDPWRWVGSGDLVMTTGGGLPEAPRDQVDWLNRLAGIGISGLILALRADAPKVSLDMKRKADELRLPLLSADFSVHFVEVARAVIESSIHLQRSRAETTMKVYNAHSAAAREGCTPEQRFAAAARAARHNAWLVDANTKDIVMASNISLSPPDLTKQSLTVLVLPTRPPMLLVTEPHQQSSTNDGVVEHLASLAALECEHSARDRDQRRAAGTELLAALVDERLDLGAAHPELSNRGIGKRGVLALACTVDDGTPLPHEELHHVAALRDCEPLLLHRSPTLFALIPDDESVLHGLCDALGPHARLGVSNPIGARGSLREFIQQAHLALARAGDNAGAIVRYAMNTHTVSVVPHTVEECKSLVDAVLGPLIDYDNQHASELVPTLRTFLNLDRSAQKTADSLHIHRQTLTYRLRRIQELSGRSSSASADVAIFWIAFEAANNIGLGTQASSTANLPTLES